MSASITEFIPLFQEVPQVGDVFTVNGEEGVIENVQKFGALYLIGLALEDGPDGKGLYSVVVDQS